MTSDAGGGRPFGQAEVPVVRDRQLGRNGELVLRQCGEHFEIVSNGVFLMDTRDGRSERLLVRLAMRDLAPGGHVLIAGLGVGFSLAEALTNAEAGRITVVELEPVVASWQATFLAERTGARLDDPRVRLLVTDIASVLADPSEHFDAICLDVDNGPGWTVTAANDGLYGDAGIARLAERLTPSGVATVWSAADNPAFATRLSARFAHVETHRVPVPRGEPDVVFCASGPRAAG